MRLRKLDELMVKRGGSVDPSKFKDEVFELLSIPAFDNGSPEFLAGSDIGSSKKVVEPRDVLLSKIVPHIRRCWVVPERNDKRQIASGEWIQFRSDDFYPDYLRLFLISDRFHSQFMKTVKGVGGSLLRASPAQVAEIVMPFPPLDDQIRIAHLLGKVEGLIAQRKQHLQQLDDLFKSVFLEIFGDPVRNEKGWDIESCEKAVLEISSGTSYGGEDRPFENPEEIGVLKISAVTKGTFDPAEFKVVDRAQITKALRYVKRGDFLFSRANTIQLVAACCVVPEDYDRLFLPDKLWVLTLNEHLVKPQFLNYLLKNERYRDLVRALASGGHDSMLNISMKKFMTLGIPCPPVGLQNQFVAIVEKVEALKSRYQQSLTDLEALYGALSQQAFKGDLDLSRVALPAVPVEGESPVAAAVPAPITSPVIKLPETDLLLPALKDRTDLAPLLRFWLEAYRTQSGSAVFSLERFIAAAQTRLCELHPDHDFALSADDYEAIKAWVFDEIQNRKLKQTRDIIYIDGRRKFGNQILLRARRLAQQ